jgi:hydroxyethylthiazole kinase-like uncharacterized protein yjeF
MKLLSANQIREWEANTLTQSDITEDILVERAAQQCLQYIMRNYNIDTPFVILCGVGNNGADGLALTRLLLSNGYGAKAFIIESNNTYSTVNKSNQNKLIRINASLIEYVSADALITDIPSQVIIIDAMLGIGINRPIEGWIADFIQQVNQLKNIKIAIDIPSGLTPDDVPFNNEIILKANTTLTFNSFKRSFLHTEAAQYCGIIECLNAELNPTFYKDTNTHFQTITQETIIHRIKGKNNFSHKYQNGFVQLIGGSEGKSGAIILSTLGALKSGCGIVSLTTPNQCYIPVQSQTFEAMCEIAGASHIQQINIHEKANAIGIGMGMGTHPETFNSFQQFIDECNTPCVIDADAINLLAQHEDLIHKVPQNSILTPHEKEFDRIFGTTKHSLQRAELARSMSMKYKLVIVLKGHKTIVTTPNGDCYYNTNGNVGMAKGGSGDILCGLIAGLLAQQYKAEDAALLGVFIHGLAGDLAKQDLGVLGMNAKNIADHIPFAWKKLSNS